MLIGQILQMEETLFFECHWKKKTESLQQRCLPYFWQYSAIVVKLHKMMTYSKAHSFK